MELELLGEKIKELAKILKGNQVDKFELRQERIINGIKRIVISFRIDDTENFERFIYLTDFVGAYGIEDLSEEKIIKQFDIFFSELEIYLPISKTAGSCLMNLKADISQAKEKHKVYGPYLKQTVFAESWNNVEFYLNQIEKQISKLCKVYFEKDCSVIKLLNNLKALALLALDENSKYSFRLFKHDYRTYRFSDEIVFECLKRIKKNAEKMGSEF